MSWWTDLTNPIDKALNSNVFKAVFPVQALAQGLTQGATKLAHIGGSQGLTPANQYAAGAAGGSLLGGGAALFGGGGGTMAPYMPTSTPVMGQAGSTLGGGMGSSLNLAPSAMGSTGAAPGAAVASPAQTPMWQQVLQNQRPGGGQQQSAAPQKQNVLAQLYQMFPSLRPGSQMGGMR